MPRGLAALAAVASLAALVVPALDAAAAGDLAEHAALAANLVAAGFFMPAKFG